MRTGNRKTDNLKPPEELLGEPPIDEEQAPGGPTNRQTPTTKLLTRPF